MYSVEDKTYIWLDMFSFLYTKKYSILSEIDDIANIFEDFKKNKQKYLNIMTQEQYSKMLYACNDDYIQKYIDSLNKNGIKLVTMASVDYPQKLLHVDRAPIVLYCIGDTKLLNTKTIGVVGTRRNTLYGKKVTTNFVKVLCTNGFTIVSGMGDGIDSISHKTTLENNGKTIAVLGGGFEHIYPKSNIALYREICEKGLVISEYRPSVLSAKFQFIARDRIIAGLSNAVLITEAGEKSGSMHTKDYAIEYGRDIFAVPGNIESLESYGCNKIIKEYAGSIALSPKDILEHYDIEYKAIKVSSYQMSFNEQTVLKALSDGEKHIDEIIQLTQLDPKILISLLTTLSVRGIIEKLAGNYYNLK